MSERHQFQAAMKDAMWRQIGALEAENDEMRRRLEAVEVIGMRHLIVDLGWLLLAAAAMVGIWVMVAGAYAHRSAPKLIEVCV